MSLNYGHFYHQLKLTGFGESRLAARFLVDRFGFSLSEGQFSYFTAVVKQVRDEIQKKNPGNQLTGNEFEQKYKSWLKVRFLFGRKACNGIEL